MAKKSAWLQQRQAEVKDNMRTAQFTNERQSLDAMIIALNREFGFGADRINRFIDAYIRERCDVADLFLRDRWVDKDKELTYSKEKSDRILKEIMGQNYPSFGERYTVDIRKSMFEGGVRVR